MLAGAFAVLYAAVGLWRHAQLRSTGFDLGIFTQAVRAYAELRAPVAELKGPGYHLLGDHFHPILAALAPAYRLFPDPRTLIVAQALLLALSVVPVTKLAIDRLGQRPGLAVAAAYGLSFGLQQAAVFDFHEIAFAVPLLACSVAALARERWRAAALWALPLFLVKEDQGIIVFGIGAYLCWRGPRKLGAALMATAVAVTALLVTVVIPAFNATGGYDYLGSAVAAPANPLLRLLAPGTKWFLVAMLLAVTAFTALRSPLVLLAGPPLAARFWADRWTYWEVGFHYNAVLMPILFAAAIDGCARLRGDRLPGPRPALRVPVAAGLMLAVALLATAVWQPIGKLGRLRPGVTLDGVAAARALLATVPDGATVAADNYLSPQLVDRCTVYAWPQARVDLGRRTPWVVASDAPGQWNGTPQRYRELVAALPGEGYEEVGHAGGVRLFRERATPVPPAAPPGSSLDSR
ncbi:hypothetical protein GCM10010123_03980 [Pilimelia anulata]|uniref:DUF2079 domain-containing protein n=1 Tax=Pilimelia anulata TaxID=53371 RepID=A0A8J3F7B7_9ACTN|nr:hypothetical protein GCM10010123_03980 [Pilimelia anulata]